MNIHISVKTFWLFLLFVLFAIFITQLLGVGLVLFIAFIVFSAIKPLIDKLEDVGWKRSLAIPFVYFIIFFGLVLLIYILSLQSIYNFREIFNQISLGEYQMLEDFKNSSPILAEYIERIFTDAKNLTFESLNLMQIASGNNITVVLEKFGTFGIQGFKFFGGLLGSLFSLFMVIFLSLYMVIPRQNFYIPFLELFSESNKIYIEKLLTKTQQGLGSWVIGIISLMFIIGLATYIILIIPSLFIDGYKLHQVALLIALIAGFLEAIPNIGPVLTLIIAIVFAILLGSPLGVIIYICVAFFLLQQAEGLFLVPVVMKKAIDLHPIVSILSVIAGFELTGSPLGALISIPIVGILQIVIIECLQSLKANQK
jgi:predicted PurR-regulated permease PerM